MHLKEDLGVAGVGRLSPGGQVWQFDLQMCLETGPEHLPAAGSWSRRVALGEEQVVVLLFKDGDFSSLVWRAGGMLGAGLQNVCGAVGVRVVCPPCDTSSHVFEGLGLFLLHWASSANAWFLFCFEKFKLISFLFVYRALNQCQDCFRDKNTAAEELLKFYFVIP